MEVRTAAPSSSSYEEVYLLATRRPKKRAGRRIFKETRHPIFNGIRRRNKDKWVCEVREPNKKTRIWLGTYDTPEMAARAHDVAALALRGKAACLNFADSAWRLPVPASMDPLDIRRAAAEAAETFRPQSSEDEEFSSSDDAKNGSTEAYNVEVSSSEAKLGSSEACNGEVSSSEAKQGSSEACNGEVSSSNVNFVDEEAMFDMPNLLVSMAEGLLLSPPRTTNNVDDDDHIDVSLWSYSI